MSTFMIQQDLQLLFTTFCCIMYFLLIEMVPMGAIKVLQMVKNGTFVQVPDYIADFFENFKAIFEQNAINNKWRSC